MSGQGAPRLQVDGAGLNVAVIASSWHTEVMDGLVAAAEQTLRDSGAGWRLVRVPGSFELPLAAQAAFAGGADAVVALGVIIRGGTPHFDYVCQAATDGLLRVGLDAGRPVGFGLLTCDTEQQALDRAGLPGSAESKGAEAVEAALGAWHAARLLEAGGVED